MHQMKSGKYFTKEKLKEIIIDESETIHEWIHPEMNALVMVPVECLIIHPVLVINVWLTILQAANICARKKWSCVEKSQRCIEELCLCI